MTYHAQFRAVDASPASPGAPVFRDIAPSPRSASAPAPEGAYNDDGSRSYIRENLAIAALVAGPALIGFGIARLVAGPPTRKITAGRRVGSLIGASLLGGAGLFVGGTVAAEVSRGSIGWAILGATSGCGATFGASYVALTRA